MGKRRSHIRSHRIINFFIIVFVLVVPAFFNLCHALPFNIVPAGALPQEIPIGETVSASYTVTNNTGSQRNDNFIKYLPPNVTIVGGGCADNFNLAPHGSAGDTCLLNLLITGPVNGNDPDPTHHLFACFPGGLTCAGTPYALNVVQVPRLLSIAVTPASASIPAGVTQQFTATGHYSDGSTKNISTTVSWDSSSLGTATINGSGLATGVSAGSSTITATIGTTTSNAAVLTVTPAIITSISITPAAISIAVGETQQFTAISHYSDGSTQDITSTATWHTSSSIIATINSAGLATGVSVGSTNITAVSGAVTSNIAVLTITPVALASIDVTPTSATIAAGQTQQFAATGHYTDGTTQNITSSVSWNSTNMSVATINSVGLATGVGVGSTGITATSGSITSNSASLTVTAPILNSLAITPSSANIVIAGTQQYTAIGTYSDGSTQDLTSSVIWTPSVPAVATIGSTGLATGVSLGTTNISAASGVITSNTATLLITVFFYVVNNGNNAVSYCTINTDGTFGTCNTTGSGLNAPRGIALNAARSIAYITNNGDSTVSYCSVNSNGTLSNCTPTGNGFSGPAGVAINAAEDTVYVVNQNTDNVSYCEINVDGSLGTCNTTGSGFHSPLGITLNAASGFAYITNNSTDTVSYCVINGDNTFGACNDTTGNGFNNPTGIVLNAAGSFAYITNNSSDTVSYCPVNGDGTFSACNATGSGFNQPAGITLNAASSIAYMSNNGNSTLSYCAINGGDGTLGSCNTTGSGFNAPFGVF